MYLASSVSFPQEQVSSKLRAPRIRSRDCGTNVAKVPPCIDPMRHSPLTRESHEDHKLADCGADAHRLGGRVRKQQQRSEQSALHLLRVRAGRAGISVYLLPHWRVWLGGHVALERVLQLPDLPPDVRLRQQLHGELHGADRGLRQRRSHSPRLRGLELRVRLRDLVRRGRRRRGRRPVNARSYSRCFRAISAHVPEGSSSRYVRQ
jgi:hypothetical protein